MAKSKKSSGSGKSINSLLQVPSLEKNWKLHDKAAAKVAHRCVILNSESSKQREIFVTAEALAWQQEQLLSAKKDFLQFTGTRGACFLLQRSAKSTQAPSHEGLLEESDYTWYREQAGIAYSMFRSLQLKEVRIDLINLTEDQIRGVIVGLCLSSYSYRGQVDAKMVVDAPKLFLQHNFVEADKKPLSWFQVVVEAAQVEASAVNFARHLVNLPPNLLNPKSLSTSVKQCFQGKASLKIEVWEASRLKAEGMGLHLGVGQGAEHAPCMMRFKYRPKGSAKQKPIAFVGKGITFDSGGYDIKPSAGMRLMKKDMGGAAAVLGILNWAVNAKHPQALDFYIGLAENMVDAKAMRPSDVLTARNGMKVEIHNTDAEGRLVLADVLDVAVTQKAADEPKLVIDLATLTGAIKVALGADIAGLFSNHDALSDQLMIASQRSGDLSWRMPLLNRYSSSFSSSFADMVNAVDGFGGAITAALFLEKFVRNKPWAHLDIYAWNDKPTGSLGFAGGSGQAVQMCIEYLKMQSAE